MPCSVSDTPFKSASTKRPNPNADALSSIKNEFDTFSFKSLFNVTERSIMRDARALLKLYKRRDRYTRGLHKIV